MLFEANGKYNNLSAKFRQELEEKVRGYGKVVRYKLNIAQPDPHPDNKGKMIYPSRYTLDPVTFFVKDPYDKEKPMKEIALVMKVTTDEEKRKGENDRLERIRLVEANKGVLALSIADNHEDFERALYLELHPKLDGGKFSDKTKAQVIKRIDEKKLATEKSAQRSERKKAFDVVEKMSDADVVKFAQANEWDENEEMEILRERIEEMAETTPQFFNSLVDGKKIELRSLVKRAKDAQVISFDPAENKFIWCANQQVAAMLQVSEKTDIEALADWLESGGEAAKKVHDKIKSLLK